MTHRWTISPDHVTDDEQGQGLVEYAFILLLVAIAVVGTAAIFGTTLRDQINTLAGLIP